MTPVSRTHPPRWWTPGDYFSSVLDAGIEQPTRRLTVGAFLDSWLAGLPARVEPSTVTNYTDMVKTHLKPALGATIISQLTVSDVNTLW
ncbi:MAG: hypothetical protein ACRD0S_04715, partial [Acidimicrobiales bacterium]